MLTISTTNTTGLSLSAIVDRVDIYGNSLSPAIRWNNETEAFEEADEVEWDNAYIPLVEGTDPLTGFYLATVSGIDSAKEVLLIRIRDNDDETIIGSYFHNSGVADSPVVLDIQISEENT